MSGKLKPGFTLALQVKDVRLACQLGVDSDVPLFFGNLARELYQIAMNEMGASAQVDTAARMFERIANSNIVPVGSPTAG